MFSNIPAKLHINPVSFRLNFVMNNKICFLNILLKTGQTNSRNKNSSVFFTDKIFRYLLCQRTGIEDHMENQFFTLVHYFLRSWLFYFFWLLYSEQHLFIINVLFQSHSCFFIRKFSRRVQNEEILLFSLIFFSSVTSDEFYKIPLQG